MSRLPNMYNITAYIEAIITVIITPPDDICLEITKPKMHRITSLTANINVNRKCSFQAPIAPMNRPRIVKMIKIIALADFKHPSQSMMSTTRRTI